MPNKPAPFLFKRITAISPKKSLSRTLIVFQLGQCCECDKQAQQLQAIIQETKRMIPDAQYQGLFHPGLENNLDNLEKADIDNYFNDGHYPAFVGEIIDNRYIILQRLGKGSLSIVWLARDIRHNVPVALKIHKNQKNNIENFFDEVEMLQQVQKIKTQIKQEKMFDKQTGKRLPSRYKDTHVVKMINAFIFTSQYKSQHFCMVFEVLSQSLEDLMMIYNYLGIPLQLCRDITRQILIALKFLHEECKIIYCNIEPKNIMFSLSSQQLANTEKSNSLEKPKSSTHKNNQSKINIIRNLAQQSYQKKENYVPIKVDKNHNMDKFINNNQADLLKNLSKRIVSTINNQLNDCSLSNNNSSDEEYLEQIEYELHKDPSGKLHSSSKEDQHKSNDQEKNQDLLNKQIQNVQRQNKEPISQNHQQTNSVQIPKILCEQSRRVQQLSTGKQERSTNLQQSNLPSKIRLKLSQFNGSCWVKSHFSTQIQNQHYRAPEVVLGMNYTTKVDIWSLGCLVFEMLIGDYLFDPMSSPNVSENSEYLSLVIELLGNFKRSYLQSGTKSGHYFDSKGNLKQISELHYLSLENLLVKMYKVKMKEAQALSKFLQRMLALDPKKRSSASELLRDPWLDMSSSQFFATKEEIMANQRQYWEIPQEKDEEAISVESGDFYADESFSQKQKIIEAEEVSQEICYFPNDLKNIDLSFKEEENGLQEGLDLSFIDVTSLHIEGGVNLEKSDK